MFRVSAAGRRCDISEQLFHGKCSGRLRRHPRVSFEEAGEGVDGGDAVLAGRGEIAAQVGEALGAPLASEQACNLAMKLRGPQIPLGLIVREPDLEVVHVAEDRRSVGGKGRHEVERAALHRVALAVCRFGVGRQALGDEVLVPLGETARCREPEGASSRAGGQHRRRR